MGAKTLSTKKESNLTACWDLCSRTDGCSLLSHDGRTDTCVLRTSLADAADSAAFKVTASASRTLCVAGTDKSRSGMRARRRAAGPGASLADATVAGPSCTSVASLCAAPELLRWFYCVKGLDIAGSLVSILPKSSEAACARACDASAACRLYTLLDDRRWGSLAESGKAADPTHFFTPRGLCWARAFAVVCSRAVCSAGTWEQTAWRTTSSSRASRPTTRPRRMLTRSVAGPWPPRAVVARVYAWYHSAASAAFVARSSMTKSKHDALDALKHTRMHDGFA